MDSHIFPAYDGATFIQKRAPADPSTTTTAPATITTTTEKAVASTTNRSATTSATSSISFANNATQSVSFPEPTAASSSSSSSTTRSSATMSPFYSLSELNPTTTDNLATATSSITGSTTASNTVDASSESVISSGSIAGIVVGVFAAAAVFMAAILFIKRKGTHETKRRQKEAAYSHRVSSFGQSEFFAGPSVPPPAAPPMMALSMGYGAAAAAAGPATHYYNQQQPNPTYAPQLYSPQQYTTAAAVAIPASSLQQQQFISSQPPEDPWNSPPLGTYTVISTYTPTLDDEIYVHPGDHVQVYTEYDDGWCLGVNISRDNSRGVFPRHCLLPPSPSVTNSSAGFGLSNTNLNSHLSKRGSSLYSGGD